MVAASGPGSRSPAPPERTITTALGVLLAFTGMRWGEVVGRETRYVRADNIRVEWQSYEPVRYPSGAFRWATSKTVMEELTGLREDMLDARRRMRTGSPITVLDQAQTPPGIRESGSRGRFEGAWVEQSSPTGEQAKPPWAVPPVSSENELGTDGTGTPAVSRIGGVA